jgi:hypothetical protein
MQLYPEDRPQLGKYTFRVVYKPVHPLESNSGFELHLRCLEVN